MDDQPQHPPLLKTTITFADDRQARAVVARADAPAGEIVEALAVSKPKAVVLVFGSANSLKDDVRPKLADLFNRGLARAAAEAQAVIIDGGTEAGVMALTGLAVADRGSVTPLIGVSPHALVTYPGGPEPGSIPDGAPLDPNHSYFVLAAPGQVWGSERPTIFKLAEALGTGLPVVAVVASGGPLATEEALQTVRHGWPMIVVKGSGGTADQIANEIERRQKPEPSDAPDDLRITEIADDGEIQIFNLETDTPDRLTRMLDSHLNRSGSEALLRMAWEQMATYDLNAKKQQNTFWFLQRLILGLSVIASILAIFPESWQWLSNSIGESVIASMSPQAQEVLRWTVVAITASIGLLIAYNNRFNAGNKWVLLRSTAEAVKREIYGYRLKAGIYSDRYAQERETTRDKQFVNRLRLMTGRLQRTEVNESGLARYDTTKLPIPPKMYGAAEGDDGFSNLTPERYIVICVGDQVTYLRKKTVELDRDWKRWQFVAYALIAAGTILAAIGADLWVPVTAAAVTAIITLIRTHQYDALLTKHNQAETDLVNLRAWWESLSQRDRRDQANIDRLARLTDYILESENAGWVQRMQDALAELRESQQEQSIDKDQGGRKSPANSSAEHAAAAKSADSATSTPTANGAVRQKEAKDEANSEEEV